MVLVLKSNELVLPGPSRSKAHSFPKFPSNPKLSALAKAKVVKTDKTD